jgi:hypothetical protein
MGVDAAALRGILDAWNYDRNDTGTRRAFPRRGDGWHHLMRAGASPLDNTWGADHSRLNKGSR